MPYTYTPLRYPGGKTKLYSYVKAVLDANNLHGTYIEPFAGGAGLALKLLFMNDVKRIVINDSDPAIFSIWQAILETPDELCRFVSEVPLTIDEWEKQRENYMLRRDAPSIELAKSALFLNRTNISGVIKGGVIGGKNQTGTYKMDARFNRDELIRKIREIHNHRDQIDIFNLDALEFLNPTVLRHYYKALINFDPPYVVKGSELYMNAYQEDDHRRLCDAIKRCSRKWIVTYDVCDLIADLYGDYRNSYLDLTYSANGTRKAKEFVFFSNNLIIPDGVTLIDNPKPR